MTRIILNKVWIFFFVGLSILIIVTEFFIVRTAKFASHPDLLSFAVTLDIAVVIPLLYYFLISRKLKVTPVTTIIVFLICTGIATLILPSQNQFYLDKIKYLLLLAELAIITYGVIKIRKIVQAYKCNSENQNDFIFNITIAIQQVLGNSKIWAVVIGEINTIRYGLFFWLGEKEIKEGQRYFSTYKNSGYTAIWSIIFFVMLIETTGLHLLFRNWSPALAIVLTLLSIYTIIFFISDLAAIIKRPIVFNNDKLFFRIGIRWNSIIDPGIIQSVEIIRNFDKEKNKDTLTCALAGDPNIKIILKEKIIFRSFYGIKKTADKFVFNIDNEKEFLEKINKILQQRQQSIQ